jgi:putative ABC transport system permease protein
VTWLDRLLHRKQLEKQLDAELRFHYDQRVAEHIDSGMSESEARRSARLEFGGLEQVREECRDARGFQLLDSFLRDLRYAVRALRRSPGFTFTAIVTLAIGIGVNAAVFTVANAVLFKGFPLVYGNDRILYIDTRRENGYGCCVSFPDFEDWRAQAKSFKGMAAMADMIITLSDKGELPERYDASQVSTNAFKLLGQQPILGRDFTASDEIPGAPPVAILRYSLWEGRFGKDPAIIGRTVRINGVATTVIGVMPQRFSFPQNQDLWVPLVPIPNLQKREARGLWFAFGRMTDGATPRSARAEMETIGRRLASAYPLTNQDSVPRVRNFHEFFIGSNATMLYGSMWGAVGFVLLIACANLANLMLARSIARSREISLRIALGAGRWRIVRQLLIESVMLSAIGGIFGWWIAEWGVRAYGLVANPPAQSWSDHLLDFTMDGRAFAYLIAISTGTGLLFGLASALRLSKIEVNATLKDGSRGATGGGRAKRLSALPVIGEMALAVVLLSGAGLMIRSFLNLYNADLGIKTANILTALVQLPVAKYPRAEAQLSFYARLQTLLEAVPGVEAVAIADYLPTQFPKHLPYELAGATPVDAPRRPTLAAVAVSPGYFRTLGATVLSGRDFNDTDGITGIPAAIVNQQFAAKSWPGENALGKRFRLFDGKVPEGWRTVVGVVPNIAQNTQQEFDPLVYLPYRVKPAGSMWVFVRTRVPPGSLATTFRREIQALDSDLPIWLGPFTLADRLEWNWHTNAVSGALFLIFASIALVLASIGLYAVNAYSASQRSQEIGIRIAMGATASDIHKLVFVQGMLPLGIGLTIGLAASVAANRLLQSALVDVSPTDPITLVVASGVLALSGTVGCLIPARRAMRVDPVVALRHE